MASRSGLRTRARRTPSVALPRGSAASAAVSQLDRRLPWATLGVLLLAAGAFFYLEGRDQIFWFDEWAFVLGRRGGDLSTFLEPHNEHLSALPIAVYKLLLATAGMDDYGPYRLTVIGLHLLCVLLLFVYASRRIGGWLALVPATLILFLGPAWQNIIWPFQIGWLASLAAGLGALLLLDRRDRLGDLAASGLLVVSLSSSGLGVPIAAGVLVEFLWTRRRRSWVAAAPLALYVLWYVGYAESHATGQRIARAPAFIADAAAASLSSLVGLAGEVVPDAGASLEWGRPLAVLAAGLLVWRIARLGKISGRLAMLLAGAIGFWALTAVSRAGVSAGGVAIAPPQSSRYVYVGALFIVLIAVELLRGVAPNRVAIGVITALVAIAVLANLGAFRDAARSLRERSAVRAANLGAIEIARDTVDPGFETAPYVRAGPYLAAAAADGSPALTSAQIAAASEEARASADNVLARAHEIGLAPGGLSRRGGPRPTVESSVAGRVRSAGSCVSLLPAAYQSPFLKPGLDLVVPSAGLVLTAQEGGPVELSLRRFASGFPPWQLGTLAGGRTAILRIPDDRATRPWHVHLAPAGRVTACGLGARRS
jgi:hypothetical protein